MAHLARGSFSKSLSDWLKLRVPLRQFTYEHLANKEIPLHRGSWLYFLGGVTLFCFLVQLLTGALLMFYYRPTTMEAHSSIQFINRVVPGGLFVRNLHIWTSNAMILFLFLHAASVAMVRGYRQPRELTWCTGVLSMFLVLALGFSGYLLPWNTLSVYATKVGYQIMHSSTEILPGLLAGMGPLLAGLVFGSGDVGQLTLTRFYALHVLLLPLSLIGLIFVHLMLVQVHGMSVPISILKRQVKGERGPNGSTEVAEAGAGQVQEPVLSKTERFFPSFFMKDLAVWAILLGALSILSVVLPYDYFLPYTLAAAYDPLAPAPLGIKPEWYFYFLYYPLEVFSRPLVISATICFFTVLLFAPFILQNLPRLWKARFQESRFPTIAAALVLAVVILLTLFGADLVRLMTPVPQ